MSQKCVECDIYTNHTYFGVANYYGDLIQMYRCDVCNSDYRYYKSVEKKNVFDTDIIDDLLEYRVECPKCASYVEEKVLRKRRRHIEDNLKNFQYKYVKSNGGSKRFYCTNHPLNKHARYEFRYDDKFTDITLKEFFEEIFSNDDIVDIHSLISNLNLKMDSLLTYLLNVRMPKTIIAKIIGKSRPTIDRMIKKIEQTDEIDMYDNSIVVIKDSDTLFEIKIKVEYEFFETLKDCTSIEHNEIFYNP